VRFIERRKTHTIANVAIARELAGWCWSLAVLEEYSTTRLLRRPTAGGSAWSDPRNTMSRPDIRRGDARC
jgi:hypothetical protein